MWFDSWWLIPQPPTGSGHANSSCATNSIAMWNSYNLLNNLTSTWSKPESNIPAPRIHTLSWMYVKLEFLQGDTTGCPPVGHPVGTVSRIFGRGIGFSDYFKQIQTHLIVKAGCVWGAQSNTGWVKSQRCVLAIVTWFRQQLQITSLSNRSTASYYLKKKKL